MILEILYLFYHVKRPLIKANQHHSQLFFHHLNCLNLQGKKVHKLLPKEFKEEQFQKNFKENK